MAACLSADFYDCGLFCGSVCLEAGQVHGHGGAGFGSSLLVQVEVFLGGSKVEESPCGLGRQNCLPHKRLGDMGLSLSPGCPNGCQIESLLPHTGGSKLRI